MRTVFRRLDDRIRCAIAVGFMTTWREFLLDKCFTIPDDPFAAAASRLDFQSWHCAPSATMVLL
jgi:hypothetical protein